MERTAAYLQRLYTAKRKVEHRITALGGVSEPVGIDMSPVFSQLICSVSHRS